MKKKKISFTATTEIESMLKCAEVSFCCNNQSEVIRKLIYAGLKSTKEKSDKQALEEKGFLMIMGDLKGKGETLQTLYC